MKHLLTIIVYLSFLTLGTAATFTVTTNNDIVAADAVTSLREAINMANATPGADIIVFDPSINGLTISITGAAGDDNNLSGDFDLTDPDGVTITGNGIFSTIIDGDNLDRIFDQIDGNFTLNNVTVQNGNVGAGVDGGAIESSPVTNATLTLVNCNFQSNMAENGGAIDTDNNTISFTATDCIFNQNIATEQGGGMHFDGPFGIFTARLTRCTITNNTAQNSFGGGLVFNASNGPRLDIIDCLIAGNQAPNRIGGGVSIRRTTITTITNSSISGNTAVEAGGIDYDSSSGILNITNSTISGNRATEDAGGIRYNTGDSLNLNFVTITANIADDDANGSGDGGGIGYTASGADRFTFIHNSIIQGNDDESPGQTNADDCGDSSSGPNRYVSRGGNVFGNGTGCPAGTNDTTGDAMLATLADNGGNTQTHALMTGSSAINFATCDTITQDQRGFARSDGMCDAGAFEFGSSPCPTGQMGQFFAMDGTVTIPTGVTQINIIANGASGGNSGGAPIGSGGSGATVTGDFTVSPGDALNVFVGLMGASDTSPGDFGGGGGGGSAVTNTTSNALLVVAGGGGGGATSGGGNGGGGGANPIVSNDGASTNVGTAGTTTNAPSNSGGGGAFNAAALEARGGQAASIASVGAGGTGTSDGGAGFGGGGGSRGAGGGGGGGYNGGDSQGLGRSGLGGDSFFNSTRAVGTPTNTAGNNAGNGSVQVCWVLPCMITAISTSNLSDCSFDGTNSTFTADVSVTFANAPSTGMLNLTGDGTASVDVSSLSSTTSHTFTGVSLPADGGAINLTATFSANTSCTFNQTNAGTAPEACPCSITAITSGNFSSCAFDLATSSATFMADITVTFANAPSTGTLDLTGDGTASVNVTSLSNTTSHTFTGLSLPANGGSINLSAAFSALATCNFSGTAGTAPSSCAPINTIQGNCDPAQLFLDFGPTSDGIEAEEVVLFNNKLFFSGVDPAPNTGDELASFDGTTISLAADIDVGSSDSEPEDLFVFNNKLYFEADDGINDDQLWVFDGTTASLVQIINPTGRADISNFTIFNNKLYFIADDGTNGEELWVFDGTSASMVQNIGPGNADGVSGNRNKLIVFNNKLYFRANDGTTGAELWVYDGTTASIVQDFNPTGSLVPANFVLFNNLLFFTGNLGAGNQLFSFDGTTISNRNVPTSRTPGFTIFRDKLYFRMNDASAGLELGVFDGTTGSLVADLNPGPDDSDPRDFIVFNDRLYFSAEDPIHGRELWLYDGSSAGLLLDIRPGAIGGNPDEFILFQNRLFFIADDGPTGDEFWSIGDNCQSDVAATPPIPTMGQWGVLIFGLLILNIGLVLLGQLKKEELL